MSFPRGAPRPLVRHPKDVEVDPVRLLAAAIQMSAQPLRVAENLDRADALLAQAHLAGAELAVLPEMFNTGYGLVPCYAEVGEGPDGPTLAHLRRRSVQWGLTIAAGFVERDGHHLYDSVACCQPGGRVDIYRKRHLVFWEPYRFRAGKSPLVVNTPFGRMGFAVCADMIYRGVWDEYRDRIDLAVIASAWPDFADRETGRKNWLFGKVGPMAGEIPARVAQDLGVPVIFANQCGPTLTRIPIVGPTIADRFCGRSAICDGRHGETTLAGTEEEVVLAPVTLQPARGPLPCRSTSPSALAA